MSGINKVIVLGRLGQDPEMKAVGSSTVTRLNIATSEKWTDKNGQKQERTEWHRVVVWGKLAELCAKYLAKGRLAYIEGKLQTRSWEDNGIKKYSTEIIASTVQFLDSKDSQAASSSGSTSKKSTKQTQQEPEDSSALDNMSPEDFDFGPPTPQGDDSGDIPF